MTHNFPGTESGWKVPFFNLSQNCFFSLFCAPCTYGLIRNALEDRTRDLFCGPDCFVYLIAFIFRGVVAAPTRHRIIEKYNFSAEDLTQSCLLHTFCYCFALGQEADQLELLKFT